MGYTDEIYQRIKRTIQYPFLPACVFFTVSFCGFLFPIWGIQGYHEKNEMAILSSLKESTYIDEVRKDLTTNSRKLLDVLIALDFCMSLIMASMYFHMKRSAAEEIRKLTIIERDKVLIKDKQDEISFRLQAAHSDSQNLKNTISGVNHEVSPWLGIILNVSNMLGKFIELKGHDVSAIDIEYIRIKVGEIEKSASQCIGIVENLSRNVKYLQKYDMASAKIGASISAMVSVALMNSSIRKNIRPAQIEVDYASLDFLCAHSPMFLQQILLNLVNNAIDHNEHMKETILIKIHGNPTTKAVFVEDNGKGIPAHVMRSIFSPNFSTKNDTSLTHGLGLSMCMNYAISMGAFITVESEVNKYTKFTVQFEMEYADNISDLETEAYTSDSPMGNRWTRGDASNAYKAYKKRKDKGETTDLFAIQHGDHKTS